MGEICRWRRGGQPWRAHHTHQRTHPTEHPGAPNAPIRRRARCGSVQPPTPLRPEGPIVGCDPFQSIGVEVGRTRAAHVSSSWAAPITVEKRFACPCSQQCCLIAAISKVGLRADAISKLGAMDLASEMCAKQPVRRYRPLSRRRISIRRPARGCVTSSCKSDPGARRRRAAAGWYGSRLPELNRTDIQGEQASDFLPSLYEQVRTVDWLRIVLDDMKGDALTTPRAVTERHRVDNVTESISKPYLSRAIAEFKTPEGDVCARVCWSGVQTVRTVARTNEQSTPWIGFRTR